MRVVMGYILPRRFTVEILATLLVFALCMAGLGVGIILSQSGLRGTCGSDPILNKKGEALTCGACPKKEAEVCPSDDPLVALAQIGSPTRDLDH